MPDSGTWIDHMRKGSFEKAWEFSDSILRARLNRDYLNLPRHYQCIWDGTPLEGKRVLIRCYHGLGDTIMFIRYARLVKQIAVEVIVWAQPRLIELLKSADGIDAIIPLHDGIPEAEYDTDVEIMELPHIFRTTIATIPDIFPYLHAEPLKIFSNDSLSIGLVWKAGDWDNARSVQFELLKPLFSIEGLNICILQDNASEAGWIEGFGFHPGKCTLHEHARITAGLDLMITVDSMPAHLAGALNVPVWVLLNDDADWRWMEDREDSPWYPSMRLFRKGKKEDWTQVISRISDQIINLNESQLHRESFGRRRLAEDAAQRTTERHRAE